MAEAGIGGRGNGHAREAEHDGNGRRERGHPPRDRTPSKPHISWPTGLAVGLSPRLALHGHQTAIRPMELGSPAFPRVRWEIRHCGPYQDLTASRSARLCCLAVEPDDRTRRILERVRAVPAGLLRSYGDVSPGAPRVAGAVLHGCDDPAVPWHRIVRADGSLAKGDRPRALLGAEGLPFRG